MALALAALIRLRPSPTKMQPDHQWRSGRKVAGERRLTVANRPRLASVPGHRAVFLGLIEQKIDGYGREAPVHKQGGEVRWNPLRP